MKRLAISLIVFVLFLSGDLASAAETKLPVVASFTILADIVKNVGGDAVEVKSLVGPNGDAHAFEPTPADAKAIGQAKLVVINGLGMEGWIERLVKTSGYKGAVCVASNNAVLRKTEDGRDHESGHKHEHKHEHKHGKFDPHAWQSLANGQIYADNVAAALGAADPANVELYKRNADAYKTKIRELDAWAKAEFAAIPKEKRRMITSHDALGYLGAAFDIEIHSPMGFSTESEPSAKQVAKLIKQIRKEKISAIFIENVSDPRLIDQIAKESGASMGGELYSDALSKPDGPASTYLEMYKSNVSKIIEAMKK